MQNNKNAVPSPKILKVIGDFKNFLLGNKFVFL